MAIVGYQKLATYFLVTGFMLYALTITMKPFTGHDQAVEGLILAGFVAYVLTFLMIVAGYHGFMDGSCFAAYVTITAAFAAGCLGISGLAIYIDKVNDKPEPHAATLLVASCLLAIVGGTTGLVGRCRARC